ncbi:MAG: sulfite exporter TauE/SafE family protein [Candidatus Hodarchaeota archaeon]
MEINAFNIILHLCIGLGIGIFSSLSGTGGGVLKVPVFEMILLMDITVAQGTSTLVIFVSSIFIIFAYAKQKRIDYKSGLIIVVFSAPMAILGVLVSNSIASGFITGKLILTIIFYIFLVYVGIRMLVKKISINNHDENGDIIPFEGKFAITRKMVDRDGVCFEHSYKIAKVVPLSLLAGFVSGFFGIGGGAVQVPLLHNVCGMGIHVSVATSGFIIFFNSIVGTISRLSLGQIDLFVGLIYTIAEIVGAFVGAKIAKGTSRPKLKKTFSIMLLAIAAYKIMTLVFGF